MKLCWVKGLVTSALNTQNTNLKEVVWDGITQTPLPFSQVPLSPVTGQLCGIPYQASRLSYAFSVFILLLSLAFSSHFFPPFQIWISKESIPTLRIFKGKWENPIQIKWLYHLWQSFYWNSRIKPGKPPSPSKSSKLKGGWFVCEANEYPKDVFTHSSSLHKIERSF